MRGILSLKLTSGRFGLIPGPAFLMDSDIVWNRLGSSGCVALLCDCTPVVKRCLFGEKH
jgi:hypothetical protein